LVKGDCQLTNCCYRHDLAIASVIFYSNVMEMTQDLFHLCGRKDNREPDWFLRSFDMVDIGQFDLKNLLIQKQQGTQGHILSRSSHGFLHRQVDLPE
jgi:hypothetical protein